MSPTITPFHILYALRFTSNATTKTMPPHFILFSTLATNNLQQTYRKKGAYLLRISAKKRLSPNHRLSIVNHFLH